ncbi:energy-coupling factor ABC transporter ATP-binding protein [Desulfovibrio mangrovi]|uniref:ABC transporter ATP-binding protein n=1 Tax=Desulfovibrio mangrovi TaxID=2976983 RepID=UPI0022479B86|nr:ABC transporter ATP-binding protein [Desulfovibrio mangrovi]UZP68535.1 energy-coupling factor ABC transporter ATP-binding protein [Desulfovibrio mangrovi]
MTRKPILAPLPSSEPLRDAIEIDDLNFTYAGVSAPSLSGITLRIRAGEFVGLAGRNNAGKSTLCHALAGVIPHLVRGSMQGAVRICGIDTTSMNMPDLSARIAFVMQKPDQQLSGMRFTVREEVAFGLENQGIERSEMLQRINAALCMTGLEALADHSPHHLSGGQLQRLMLAAAIAGDSPILVLDEPTTFLDPAGELAMLDLLRQLCDTGRIVILTNQRPCSLAAHADRILVLHEGKLELDGTPREVLTSQRLLSTGLGVPRYTQISRLAQQHGIWGVPAAADATEPAPAITLEQTLAGLKHLRQTAAQPPTLVPDLMLAEESFPPRPAGDTRGIFMEKVCFSYETGPEVLTDITLSIGNTPQGAAGEAWALLGHNGSGKSTLVRHFNGLLKPLRGTVHVNGTPTSQRRVAQVAQHVALLFQNPDDQICKSTVQDEVALGPRNLGYQKEQVQRLVETSLHAMGLTGMERYNPYDLGLSERKRLAIASVLAMDTDIVVLDEPTAGLDASEIALLEAAIRHLTASGKSVVAISHDMDFVAENFSLAICLEAGQIRYQGPVANLFTTPSLLQQCGLMAPQVIQAANGCGVTLETITPEALVERLTTGSALRDLPPEQPTQTFPE